MSFKRSRSAVNGDNEVVTPRSRPPVGSSDLRWQRRNPPSIRPANPPAEKSKCSDQAPTSIFRISSPGHEMPGNGDEKDDFLERCFSCNSIIFLDGDIFMYRDMRAFCTTECRQKQMDSDGKAMATKRARNQNMRTMPNAP